MIRPSESDKWASIFLFLQTQFLLEVRAQAKIWQSKPSACSANTANAINKEALLKASKLHIVKHLFIQIYW